jgi:hypothetical protein
MRILHLVDGVLGGEDGPRNLTLDFTTMADGALAGLNGSTWSIASGKLINTPATGNELLSDTGMETWSSATNLTSYQETIAGTSTINQEATIKHAGNYSCRMDIDASGSNCQIRQALSNYLNQWAVFTYWLQASAANKKGIAIYGASSNGPSRNPGTSMTQYVDTYRISENPFNPGVRRAAGESASSSLYWDDFSVKILTFSTLFAWRKFASQYGIVKAGCNVVAGTPEGVYMNMDSFNNPLNMVTCLHNGANLILSKRVNGTVTELINTAAAYSAGALVEIRRAANTNTYRAFYNGSQVGTDQTISDASIINNKYHGLMGTHQQNQVLNFSFTGA